MLPTCLVRHRYFHFRGLRCNKKVELVGSVWALLYIYIHIYVCIYIYIHISIYIYLLIHWILARPGAASRSLQILVPHGGNSFQILVSDDMLLHIRSYFSLQVRKVHILKQKLIFPVQILFFEKVIFSNEQIISSNEQIIVSKQIINFQGNAHIYVKKVLFSKQQIIPL